MKCRVPIVALLMCGALAAPALAQSADDLAAKFGAREAVLDMSISPDGKHVAIIAPARQNGEALLVADLVAGGAAVPILAAGEPNQRLRHCFWPSDTRLVCRFEVIDPRIFAKFGYSRMVSLNLDGSDVKRLSAEQSSTALGFDYSGGALVDLTADGKPGHVLMTRNFIPERDIGKLIAQRQQGLGVELVDAVTLDRRVVEAPRKDAVEYISDGEGTVRIMGTSGSNDLGYDRGFVAYSFRKAGSRDWLPLGQIRQSATGLMEGFNPYAVDRQANMVYGFDAVGGRTALVRISLDGTKAREVVLARPDVDVDDLVRIGRKRRVVGASYAGEYRTTEFFDKDIKALSNSLTRALPGKPQISVIDASADENRLLLRAGADIEPGMFYIYDKTTHKLEEVLPERPQLAGVALGAMKPVRFPAADGTMIPGYLTLPPGSTGRNLPAVVMPHGGPAARDHWGFDWLVQFFATRGYAVLQPEFRGSTGYGSEWYQKNGFQSWRTAIGDVDAAGRWLVSQGVAAPDKLGIVGWSYGGYAALQSGVLDPGLFKAIVAIAPVTDLEQLRTEYHDYSNFPQIDRQIGNGPHVTEGSPARNAVRIAVPVLMFHGSSDQNVGIAQSRAMAGRLRAAGKQVELIEFPGLDHQLGDASARSTLLGRSDQFLRKAFGL